MRYAFLELCRQHCPFSAAGVFITATTVHCTRCGAAWAGASPAHCCACHRTFSAVGLFDAHSSSDGVHGTCRNPAGLTVQSGPRAGEPVMFFRDGLWSGPQMSDEQLAHIGWGNSRR